MARRPRHAVPGQALHVIQRGNNRQAVFFADADYRFYHEALEDASHRYGCAVHAYVFMTNHVHLLLTPCAEDSASRVLQSLGRRYVRYINTLYRRTGTLWEGRFKSAIVSTEQYLLTCARYIELNPVRAGMVAAPQDYPWSSHRYNACGLPDSLLKTHDVYRRLGPDVVSRQQQYRDLFEQHLDPNRVDDIRKATEAGTIIGDDRFRRQIEATLGCDVRSRPHGGDRKSQTFKKQGL